MENVGSVSEAKRLLLAKIREMLSTAKRLIPAEVDSVGAGIRVLSALRGELYEDLNQIQHAALVLDAAEWLDREVLTVRIPKTLRKELKALSARQQRPTSEVVRDSLRRYIAAEKFRHLRAKTLPFAEAQGFLTDEDIFEAIS